MFQEDLAGKISPEIMQSLIYPNLGVKRKEILVGPGAGLDTCVIELTEDQVLVASTDPLSLIPELGIEESAWMSVNLLANDLSTSGIAPQFLLVDLNLPPHLDNETLARYWKSLSNECSRLGISIVGGNTGKFEGCDLTIVGSGTTLALGVKDRVINSSGARVGDSVIITKGAAISTTALLSRMFPRVIKRELGETIQEKAAGYFTKISATNDCVLASSIGIGFEGVTAMHDVAEGGVFASMTELAKASSLGMKIDKPKIPVSQETDSVCGLFGINPYWSLGEGAMQITCRPDKAQLVTEKLEEGGVKSSIVGKMLEKEEGVYIEEDNKKNRLERPTADPYWKAYYSAVAKKWD